MCADYELLLVAAHDRLDPPVSQKFGAELLGPCRTEPMFARGRRFDDDQPAAGGEHASDLLETGYWVRPVMDSGHRPNDGEGGGAP